MKKLLTIIILGLLISLPAMGQHPPDRVPIGVYMQPARNFETWRDRGATFVVTDAPKPDHDGPSRDEYFAAAHAAGLGLVIAPDTDPARDVARPGFYGWYRPDEPDHWPHLLRDARGQYDVPASIERWLLEAKTLRDIKPDAMLLGVFTGSQVYWAGDLRDLAKKKVIVANDYRDWSRGANWTGADWYIIAQGSDPAKLANRQGRVIDRLLSYSQTGDVLAFVECAPVLGNDGRAPTAAEMRAQAWVGLIHGAKGLLYFPLKVRNGFSFDAVPDALDRPLTELNAEVHGYAQFILHGKREKAADAERARWTLPDGSTLTAEVVWDGLTREWLTTVETTTPTVPPEVTELRNRVAELESEVQDLRSWQDRVREAVK